MGKARRQPIITAKRYFALIATIVTAVGFLTATPAADARGKSGHEPMRVVGQEDDPAVVLMERGDLDGALAMVRKRLAADEHAHGANSVPVRKDLNLLGDIAWHQFNVTAAEGYFSRAIKAAADAKTPNDAVAVISLAQLGTVYRISRRYADAEKVYKQALSIVAAKGGGESAFAGYLLTAMAQLFTEQKRYGDANKLYTKALTVLRKSAGRNSTAVAETLSKQANSASRQGKLAKAEKLYLRAIATFAKGSDADGDSAGDAYEDLSELYYQRAAYDQAEIMAKHTLAIREKRPGRQSLSLVGVLSLLDDIYVAEGRQAEADATHKRLAVLVHSLGKAAAAQAKLGSPQAGAKSDSSEAAPTVSEGQAARR